jgi:phosphate uptake regulator
VIPKFWNVRDRAPLIYDAFEEVYGMLERTDGMFDSACRSLFNMSTEASGEPPVDVAILDEDIDYGERAVRRMVFQHLSMNPKQDLTASLILVSIVHDVERAGDYIKSLSYLSRWDVKSSAEADRSRAISEKIRPMFGEALNALRDGDDAIARSVMDRHKANKKEANAFLQEMLEASSTTGGTRDALVWNIGVQYLRRISAHLSNVASSVANPFDRLGGQEPI